MPGDSAAKSHSSAPSPLQAWLREQSSAGHADSTGEFTLAAEKAWEKLGAFQLPFAECWILKVLQAALTCQDGRVSVIVTRDVVRVEIFSLTDFPTPDRQELESVVFSPNQARSDALNHLAIGIRALVGQKDRPFSLTYADGGVVGWTGKEFHVLQPAGVTDSERERFAVEVSHLSFEQGRDLLSRTRFAGAAALHRANVTLAVTQNCYPSSSRVSLDGRPLPGVEADQDYGETEDSHPLEILRGQLEGPKPFLLAGRLGQSRKLGQHSLRLMAAGRTKPCSPSTVAAILSVHFKLELVRESMKLDRYELGVGQGRLRLLWVRDGVIVWREPLPLTGAVGMGILVSCDDLVTDLTGLKPRDDEPTARRRREALNRMLSELDDFRKGHGGGPIQVSGGILGPTVTGALGLGLAFAVPVLGVGVMARAGWKIAQSEWRRREMAHDFNRGLEALRETLATQMMRV